MPLRSQRTDVASSSSQVCLIDDRPYFVMDNSKAPAGIGGRSWEEVWVTVQEAKPEPFAIPMTSFHEGAGFSYAGLPNTYDRAGVPVDSSAETGGAWDPTNINKVATWARHATGSDLTTTDFRGWLVAHGGALYLCRGRYVRKYTPSTTHGATWSTSGSDRDLGLGNHVCGRPVSWNGALYVPVADDATDAQEVFLEITTGSPDTYQTGPADRTARAFGTRVLNRTAGGSLLVRADGNGIATCSADPLVSDNWSDGGGNGVYQACDPNVNVTEVIDWGGYTLACIENGLVSFDVNFDPKNELPHLLEVYDPENGQGSCASNGGIFLPHVSGLIDWNPSTWRFVGPSQEGATESDLTPGVLRPVQIVPYGDRWFGTWTDAVSNVSSMGSLLPSKGNNQRGPYLPHIHAQTADGSFEGCTVIRVDNTHIYLAVVHVDEGGLVARPWVWRLPLGDNSPSQDASIPRYVSNTSMFSSRFFGPQRSVLKSFREVEGWFELEAEAGEDLWDTPGVELWVAVDGEDGFRLQASGGSPAVLKETGRLTGWVPPHIEAVGHYAQLELRIPALLDGETEVAVVARELVWRGHYLPDRERVIKCMLVLSEGEFESGSPQRRTVATQRAELEALAQPPQGEANKRLVPIRTPSGRNLYGVIQEIATKEARYRIGDRDSDVVIATLTIKVERYDDAAA